MIRKSVCPLWHDDIPPALCRKAWPSAATYTTSRDTIDEITDLRFNALINKVRVIGIDCRNIRAFVGSRDELDGGFDNLAAQSAIFQSRCGVWQHY